jgi:hypothetical protein
MSLFAACFRSGTQAGLFRTLLLSIRRSGTPGVVLPISAETTAGVGVLSRLHPTKGTSAVILLKSRVSPVMGSHDGSDSVASRADGAYDGPPPVSPMKEPSAGGSFRPAGLCRAPKERVICTMQNMVRWPSWIAALLIVSAGIASAQTELLTDPAPTITTSGSITTMKKDLSGYAGAYGQGPNPGADILYGTGSGTWQFILPASINPASVSEANLAVAMVTDGTVEDPSTYIISVSFNGQTVFTGAPNIPHHTFVGAPPIVTNWTTFVYQVPLPLSSSQINVTITNQRPWQIHTWIALDWMELRINTQSTPTFNFDGFFRPVDNPPSLNVVNAGLGIPLKFSLGGDHGLGVLAYGYPKTRLVSCSTSAPTNEVEETIAAGNSSLSYDPSTTGYTYVWKTDKAWAGTCRDLVLRLSDGVDHIAQFRFK